MSRMGLPKTKQIRERLRKEAEERQAEYDKLSLHEKLERLPAAPAAARQRARLLASKAKPASKEEPLVSEEKKVNLKAKERRAEEKKS